MTKSDKINSLVKELKINQLNKSATTDQTLEKLKRVYDSLGHKRSQKN